MPSNGQEVEGLDALQEKDFKVSPPSLSSGCDRYTFTPRHRPGSFLCQSGTCCMAVRCNSTKCIQSCAYQTSLSHNIYKTPSGQYTRPSYLLNHKRKVIFALQPLVNKLNTIQFISYNLLALFQLRKQMLWSNSTKAETSIWPAARVSWSASPCDSDHMEKRYE